ncbi:unnamed protein product [Closterium sp. NIES-53]
MACLPLSRLSPIPSPSPLPLLPCHGSRFVASLEKDLSERSSTVELNVADFSATSYGTIMADELGRRVKTVPLAFFERTPTTLFPTSSSSPSASAIPQFGSFPGWKLF